jgi:nicotinamide-nucleotide amidase
MKAEIVAVGTELLLGEITDTNTPYVAQQLASLGIDLYYASTVGDNLDRLIGVLRMAWNRADIVFTTGGLGPSQGDVTRLAIAGLLGEEIYEEPGLKLDLIEMFHQRGLEVTPNNFKQATLIPSATAILNPRGTAPGWWVERDGRVIVAMPGPPGEMHVMWHSGVLPRLKARADSIILSRTLKSAGMSESKMDDMLAPYSSESNPTVATYAKSDGIHIRITAKAKDQEEAEKIIAAKEAEIRNIFNDYIWGTDNETHEAVTGKMLTARSLTIAIAESFGDCILANDMVNVPDSNRFFRGAIITASDEARIALGVSPQLIKKHEIVSVAEELAALVRSKLGADIGLAVHGEIPADSNSTGKLVIAIDGESTGKHTRVFEQELHRLRLRASQYIFGELRKVLS